MLVTFNINLNISWDAPQEVWDKLNKLYSEMPNYKGYVDGCPVWYNEDNKIIEVSVEPSGLQFYAKMPRNEWENWIELFKEKASKLLGHEIGELEDGFEFFEFD